MLAKVIGYGRSRVEAALRLERALHAELGDGEGAGGCVTGMATATAVARTPAGEA